MQEIVLSNIQPSPGLQSSTVKLDEKFNESEIEEFYAYFTSKSAELTRISTVSGNHPYGPISADVMDSLCSAWYAFKSECHHVDQQEAYRQARIQLEIDTIVAEYPEIVIQEHGNQKIYQYWSVTVELLDSYASDISTIDELLKIVQDRKTRLDQRKEAISQIMDLKAAHPEIEIKKEPSGYWGKDFRYVDATIDDWVMTSKWGHTPEEVLVAIQEAIEEINKHKAAQTPEEAKQVL